MKNKLLKSLFFQIICWIVIWISTWIIFIDYLPTHTHFEYLGVVSPLIIVILPFYGSALTANAYPLVIIPGLLFWCVVVFMIYFYRKNLTKNNKSSLD